MASYFTLQNSNSSLTKRFRVIYGGYANTLEKAQTIEKTIAGDLDVSVGSIRESFAFVVRLRYEEENSDYGTLNELKSFYSLNNTLGIPSNQITFTDHYGNQKVVIMAGNFNAQVQGIEIEGTTAWYIVNCMFMVINNI